MKILDTVWMLVRETPLGSCVIYRAGSSAKEVWTAVIDEEIMGTRVTKEYLQKQGFKAKKIYLCR